MSNSKDRIRKYFPTPPRSKSYANTKTGHDPIKPAEIKQQKGIKIGLLLEDEIREKEVQPATDVYANYEEGA